MRDRTQEILEAAVRGFIRSGEPVSSSWLYENFDFGIKPAMIRLELTELTDKGFLEQPHYSAGRVPKNRGYEFFAARVMEEEPSVPVRTEVRESFCECDWRRFTYALSRNLQLLGVSAVGDAIVKDGLDRLVEHLEWETRRDITTVIQDFEAVDRRLAEQEEEQGGTIQVFIGHKSPVTRSEQLAVVISNYQVNGEQVTVAAVGPKRMDYEKVIGTLRVLQNVANEIQP